MAEAIERWAPGEHASDQVIHKVPDPFPLSMAGMMAMLGPQAINFGISVGGGEAYLLPNIAARGLFHMHWLMLISVVLEAALVYECIKYAMYTGRSFFAGTSVLRPYGFWPWFWAVSAFVLFAWPSWMGGAVVAAQRFTGISTQTFFPGLDPRVIPPQYFWAVVALVLVLVIFYFSDRTYDFLERFFLWIMWGNIVMVLVITGISASPKHYWDVFVGYIGITFLLNGYPVGLPQTDALALYGQPGGSTMWVSFWIVAAGFAMGKYAGQVTGPLRPPEQITDQELKWDTNDPSERAKMHQWVKLGGYSLFLWWGLIGGTLMTYLYSVAGYAYLNAEFVKGTPIPTGVDVSIQMATVATGVLGPMAGWLMLIFIMVTLYDAQFPIYDTYLGRTTCDAIAVTTEAEKRRPYRFYYFIIVTFGVLLGFWMVLQTAPFIIWLAGSALGLMLRSIGALQIMMINNKQLHPEFRVGKINTPILWFTFFTGFIAVGIWLYTGGLAEIIRRWQAG
jgi:hypothetical protein